ncbi:Fibronectin-binding protein A, partial [Spraguea lophii 42_110]
MKQKMTFLDIRAIINELQKKSYYINNIYSEDNKIFYFKLTAYKDNSIKNEKNNSIDEKTINKNLEKICIKDSNTSLNKDSVNRQSLLLIEPGVRMHLTKEHKCTRITSFTQQLRKYFKRSKIEIRQLGLDRVIEIKTLNYNNTGDENEDKNNVNNIIIEMYHKGNVLILENNKIVSMLRQEKDDKEDNNVINVLDNIYIRNEVSLNYSYLNFLKKYSLENITVKEFIKLLKEKGKEYFSLDNYVYNVLSKELMKYLNNMNNDIIIE